MLGRSARDRTSVSGSLSCHVIFSNFLKLFMWKRSSFLAWRSYTVHVSQAYSRVGKTTARYTFSFVASLMPLLSHTDFRRRPNTELALAMRVLLLLSTPLHQRAASRVQHPKSCGSQQSLPPGGKERLHFVGIRPEVQARKGGW